jgi:hypothetical protein
VYSDVNGIAAVCLNSVPDAVEMALPSYLEVEVNAERTFVLHKVSTSVSSSAHALVQNFSAA